MPGQSLQDKRRLGSVCRVSRGKLGCKPCPWAKPKGLGVGDQEEGPGAVADSCLYLAVGLEPAQ